MSGEVRQEERLRRLEESGKDFRAEFERLVQRVAALESSLALAPTQLQAQEVPRTVIALDGPTAPKEVPEQDCPGENASSVKVDLKEAEEEEEGDVVEDDADGAVVEAIPSSHNCEVYTFQESMWDVQLFIGKLLGPADSVIVVAYSVINIVVQVTFCAIVWGMTSPTVDGQMLHDFLHWRVSDGHSMKNYDHATNTSLVRRVCSNFGANNVGASQQSNINNFNAYLPVESSFDIGSKLCVLAVVIWVMTVLIDLWNTETFMIAVLSLWRKSHHSGRRTLIAVGRDGQLCLQGMSTIRMGYAVLFIVLPRVTIDILLLWGGIRFLVFENTLSGLILNAVALGFILGLDELVYQLLPRRAQRIVELIEPVEKHISFVPKGRGRVDIRSYVILFGCCSIVLAAYLGYLQPKVNTIRDAQGVLCGGNLDFIYEVEPGTDKVTTAYTSPSILMRDTHAILAVTQLSDVPLRTGFLEYYWSRIPQQQQLWYGTTLEDIDDRSKLTMQDVLNSLPCSDQDTDVPSARALESHYYGGFGESATIGSYCRSIRQRCMSPEFNSTARKLCPITCGCDQVSRYDRRGCGSQCGAAVQSEVEERARLCVDPPYPRSTADHDASAMTAFFIDLLHFLEKEGKVERRDNRTTLTEGWRQQLIENTDGAYIVPDQTVFQYASNIAKWLSNKQFRTNIASPCQMVPFINRIFELNVCADVGDTSDFGTMKSLCPVACAAAACVERGVRPEWPPDVTFAELLSLQRGLQLSLDWRIVMPRLGCGRSREVGVNDIILIEQPLWTNGVYTADFCGQELNSTTRLSFVRVLDSGVTYYRGNRNDCSLTQQLGPPSEGDMFVMLGSSVSDLKVQLNLTCHTDGELTCGSVVSGSTVNASSLRGGPASERIYDIRAPDLSIVRFDTCGSALDAGVSVYRYPTNSQGALLVSQDANSTCGSTRGNSLTMTMPPTPSGDRLVVKGSGSAEGDFTVRMSCSYPPIGCGDTVSGSNANLRSNYGSSSPEMIWRLNTGRGGHFSFDTCQSTFDTDIRLYHLNMTEIFHVDFVRASRCGDWRANFTRALPANMEYNLLLEGYGTAFGNFTLAITCSE